MNPYWSGNVQGGGGSQKDPIGLAALGGMNSQVNPH